MKQVLRWPRILILALLSISVLTPIVFVSNRLKSITSVGRREFIEELSNIRYRAHDLRLNAIRQEDVEGLKEPKLILYKDGEFNSVVQYSSSDETGAAVQSNNGRKTGFFSEIGGNNHKIKEEQASQQTVVSSDPKEQFLPTVIQLNNVEFQHPVAKDEKNIRVQPERAATDEKVKEIRDKIIQAKAYLNFAPPGSNSQIVKELRTRMKELERAVGDATKDKDLSKGALRKVKPIEAAIYKARRVFDNCPAIATKLRAMTYNTEEQARAQKIQATYLMQLAARTTPKGLHCLSMRLTTEYFALDPEKRQMPNDRNYDDPNLYHYVVFSDNVLACAVVVKSTVSSSKEPEKIVFHLVTDSLNYPAVSMWFLLNPPGEATVWIQNIDNMDVLPVDYAQLLMKQNSSDPRFVSPLNHARFFLPDIFPGLNKIVFFDHDVVVQRDLSDLWSIDMKGKVVGAVETCLEGEPSFRSMNKFINFSDTWINGKIDPKACTWAFGMNLFDLREWRRQNLTSIYMKHLHLGIKRTLWKAGSMPIGWLTFYGKVIALDRRWHLVGLGYESRLKGAAEVERAAVIHYDGIMKPWLDIGIGKYKSYWNRHVPYDHPFLQQCNIHS
ncbi:PREDICTED: probable galacturonosyltransferase 6 [Tarenaya hassleriana]|uniref:probable galacturonosyltransferase 6 n=1 Tax=Tarenaya hassleriana TaxID=28532 RepID=UPI00053C9BCB|nr:PREDICTED: probable galacturonosyltransferase 6 [Tarenaya hassleriana]